jgi:hypothetical protein
VHKIVVLALCLAPTVAIADRGVPQEEAIPERAGGPRPPPPPRLAQPRTPPAELVALAKDRAGMWSCSGGYVGKLEVKVSLDGAWLQTSGVLDIDGVKVKVTEFRTFDAVAKQWTRIAMMGTTNHEISTSLGADKGVWVWTAAQRRDIEEQTKDKLTVRRQTISSGKWVTDSEAICSKARP